MNQSRVSRFFFATSKLQCNRPTIFPRLCHLTRLSPDNEECGKARIFFAQIKKFGICLSSSKKVSVRSDAVRRLLFMLSRAHYEPSSLQAKESDLVRLVGLGYLRVHPDFIVNVHPVRITERVKMFTRSRADNQR